MIRALLVDDEEMALKNLEYVLGHFPDIVRVQSFTSPLEALAYMEEYIIDMAFLDIEIPELSGMALAEEMLKIKPDLIVVFVTAYDEIAIKAFEVNALDYILKPVTVDRLGNTIERVKSQFHLVRNGQTAVNAVNSAVHALSCDFNKVVGRNNGRIYFLNLKDILFLFSSGRNISALTESGSYELQGSLVYWEERLKAKGFIRCNKSFLVNTDKIEYIAPMFKNSYIIKLYNHKETIPVSRKYAKDLKEKLNW